MTDREQVSVRLSTRVKAELEREAEERDLSRSEYIRRIIDDRHRADHLRERLDKREERITELEDQLRRRSDVEEKIDTLATRTSEPEPPFFIRWAKWWRQRD